MIWLFKTKSIFRKIITYLPWQCCNLHVEMAPIQNCFQSNLHFLHACHDIYLKKQRATGPKYSVCIYWFACEIYGTFKTCLLGVMIQYCAWIFELLNILQQVNATSWQCCSIYLFPTFLRKYFNCIQRRPASLRLCVRYNVLTLTLIQQSIHFVDYFTCLAVTKLLAK